MKRIEDLIEKYYNGETSLEEESQLHDFFQGEEIPDHLKSYQADFAFKLGLRGLESQIETDDLFAKLDTAVSQVEKEPKVVQVNWLKNKWLGRVAAGLILIVVGYLAAQLVNTGAELNNMKKEMEQMKALMLEQLESSSASGRLQAVSNSMSLEVADEETVSALIETMNFDKNMHVRTKAVEALAHFGSNPMVAKALSNALSVEEEPAVQIAIIGAMVELKNEGAIETLEELTSNKDVLQDVRDEARLGIFKLKEL